MPPFQPNDWLFKNHEKCESHRETTLRWEIFAWAVRDSIIRAGDFSRDFILTRQKMVYDNYMGGKKGAPPPPIDQMIEQSYNSNREVTKFESVNNSRFTDNSRFNDQEMG